MLHPDSSFQLIEDILQKYSLLVLTEPDKSIDEIIEKNVHIYGRNNVWPPFFSTIGTRSPLNEHYLLCVENTLCLHALVWYENFCKTTTTRKQLRKTRESVFQVFCTFVIQVHFNPATLIACSVGSLAQFLRCLFLAWFGLKAQKQSICHLGRDCTFFNLCFFL